MTAEGTAWSLEEHGAGRWSWWKSPRTCGAHIWACRCWVPQTQEVLPQRTGVGGGRSPLIQAQAPLLARSMALSAAGVKISEIRTEALEGSGNFSPKNTQLYKD